MRNATDTIRTTSYQRIVLTIALFALTFTTYANENGKGTTILDERAYWRYYVQFGPERLHAQKLKSEGEAVLGRYYGRVEKGVKRFFPKSHDWSKADWRDNALFFVTQVMNCGSNDERTWPKIKTPAPPANWMAPDFDDGSWFRQRMPMLIGRKTWGRTVAIHGDTFRQTAVRRACFRTTFEVKEGAEQTPYTLAMKFAGGVRIFLNGKEVDRAYLPKGELTPGGSADGYEMGAYIFEDDERPERANKTVKGKCAGVNYAQNLPLTFVVPKAKKHRKSKTPPDPNLKSTSIWGIGKASYYRKGWERVMKLRNRGLGPIALPANQIRKGTNVLAIELCASDLHPIVAKGAHWARRFFWEHCRIYEMKLQTPAGSNVSRATRPTGWQVWVEDIHRRPFSADFSSSKATGRVHIVASANGTFGAQMIVGTQSEVKGLKVTAGELKGPDGALIPAAALRVSHLKGHPTSRIIDLGQGRNFPAHRANPLCSPAMMAYNRFGPPSEKRGTKEEMLSALGKLNYFDHITPGVPAIIPAKSSQPIWLSLTVPAQSKPGAYTGSVRVEAEGMPALSVPVTVEVSGWRVPEPQNFETDIALEQSPYGVAKQYRVPLWSDEHFRAMEGSFRELARVGNDWIFVPIAVDSEFGNRKDSMIKWIRKTDGSWAFDYAILDRYLALAKKHLGIPRVISFAVMHGGDSYGSKTVTKVSYLDEKTGKTELLSLDGEVDDPAPWKAFATSLFKHMTELGMEESMHWGYGWDSNGDPSLIPLLAKYTPSVTWTRGAHGLGNRGADRIFTAVSRIYGIQLAESSRRGWKGKYIYMLMPRSGSSIVSCNGHSPPFVFRLMVDRALVSGLSGIARLGADYWSDSYFNGARVPQYAVGMPCVQMFWPGPKGAEPSVRFEALREGVQETEARIFMEQAIDRGYLPDDLAAKAAKTLYEHNRETLYVSVGTVAIQTHEYSSGWKERSRRLYACAEEVAKFVRFDVDRVQVTESVAARSRTPVHLKLRNWTTKPVTWKAESATDWIQLETTEGKVTGQQPLRFIVDSNKLKPNETAKGTITITAEGVDKARQVEITANVGGVFEFIVGEAYDFLGKPGHASSFGPKRVDDHAVFNVTVGASETREYTFVNKTGAPLPWKIQSPVPWFTFDPPSGKLPPLSRTFIKVTAKPTDKGARSHETILTISEEGGSASQKVKMVTHVIPKYVAPKGPPDGEAVLLASLNPKEWVLLHKSRAHWYGTSSKSRGDYGPKYDKSGSFPGAVPQITEYKLDGAGYKAFAVVASISAGKRTGKTDIATRRANFEILVDGKIRVQTGLMKAGDKPRLLVVDGLEGAKSIRLKARLETAERKNLLGKITFSWKEAKFYR